MSGVEMTTVTMKEEKRLEIIERVYREEPTAVEADSSRTNRIFAARMLQGALTYEMPGGLSFLS